MEMTDQRYVQKQYPTAIAERRLTNGKIREKYWVIMGTDLDGTPEGKTEKGAWKDARRMVKKQKVRS